MASDRDINGMTAQNWRSANTKGIMSEKLTSKKDNVKLFDAIKNIVAAAVNEIRGTANDDKYRYIVDLIMMRVRAAIENALVDNNDKLVDDIKSQIYCTVTSNDMLLEFISKYVEEKIITSDTSLSKLAEVILQTIEDYNSKNASNDTADEQNAQQANNNVNIAKSSEEASNNANEQNKKQDIKKADDANQQSNAKDESKNDKDQKKDSKKKSNNDPQVVFETISKTLNLNIEKLQKLIQQNISLISSSAKATEKNVNKKVKSVFTKKQFKTFTKILDSQFLYIEDIIYKLNKKILDKYDKVDATLKKVLKKLDIHVFNIGEILLVFGIVVGALAVIFWDKISDKIHEWFGEGDIFTMLGNLVSKIDFQKTLKDGISTLFDVIIEKFHAFVSSPMDYIINKLKSFWNDLKEFATDVYSWITGKSDDTAKQQDKVEEKTSKDLISKLDNNTKSLDNALNAQTLKLTQDCNKSMKQQNAELTNATQKVENATAGLNKKVESSATNLANAANDATSQLSKTQLPNMQVKVENTTNNSVDNLDKKATSKIDEASGKLNKQMSDLDKTIKENGAPTNVSKKDIEEIQNNGGKGGNIDTSFGQSPSAPNDVVKNTVNEQGKQQDLYSDKKDVDAATRNMAEIDKLNDDFLPPPPNVENNQTVNNQTNNTLKQRLIITGPNGEQLDKVSLDKKDKDFSTVIESLTNAEKDLKANNSTLEELRANVNSYLNTLNACVKNIIDLNDKKTSQQNTVIVSTSNKQSSAADAGLEDM